MDPFTASMLGSLGAGVIGAWGQSQTNAANAEIAKMQMAFQERMSNTAWQRGVQDMVKAGLNPALAYERGGASTPAGASATMQNTMAPLQAGATGAMSAAQAKAQFQLGVARQAQELEVMKAQARRLDSETSFNLASAAARLEGVNLDNRSW